MNAAEHPGESAPFGPGTRAYTPSDFEPHSVSPQSSRRRRILARRSANPTVLEVGPDGSGCSLSRRTGEGQGEGWFVPNTTLARELCLHGPYGFFRGAGGFGFRGAASRSFASCFNGS